MADEINKKLNVVLAAPCFSQFVRPNGWLCDHTIDEPVARACHACFYYALIATDNWEQFVLGNTVLYEHELDPVIYFRDLFTNTAFIYQVKPDEIIKHWSCVEMQFKTLGYILLPDAERFRFNNVPNININ